MKPPPIRYADSPEGKIAYQVLGDGPIDLIFHAWPRGNLDIVWEHPPLERFFRRLAAFSRLILFNSRGTGLSDPVPLGAPPTFEEWTMDYRWVMDAAGSTRAAILGTEVAWDALLFAATFPERTLALAVINGPATYQRHDDYPWGVPAEALKTFTQKVVSGWGTGEVLETIAPELADDERFREWFGRLERTAMSPANADRERETLNSVDLRGILPSIKAPTLVISHAGVPRLRPGHGRYLAEHIPNARYAERPGFWGLYWVHDVDWVVDELQSFFTGTRGTPDPDDRVLATVLFTDIVGSTKRAADLGDERWRTLLDQHDTLVRHEIERFRGRLIKSTGDGFLTTFDGPARGIRCAQSVSNAVHALGIEVRAGLHTGEVELRDQDIGGIAVHVAERVTEEAGASEVLVSGSVPPLVAGSLIAFVDRGMRALKGIPGEWRLFAVKA